jgi:hypothetical protein
MKGNHQSRDHLQSKFPCWKVRSISKFCPCILEIKWIPGIITSVIETGAVVENIEKANGSCIKCLKERYAYFTNYMTWKSHFSENATKSLHSHCLNEHFKLIWINLLSQVSFGLSEWIRIILSHFLVYNMRYKLPWFCLLKRFYRKYKKLKALSDFYNYAYLEFFPCLLVKI